MVLIQVHSLYPLNFSLVTREAFGVNTQNCASCTNTQLKEQVEAELQPALDSSNKPTSTICLTFAQRHSLAQSCP